MSYRCGSRAPIRDKILELMADGKPRKSTEIASALNWPTSTSITKTLTQLKLQMRENHDPRRLLRVKFDNCRKGIEWTLVK